MAKISANGYREVRRWRKTFESGATAVLVLTEKAGKFRLLKKLSGSYVRVPGTWDRRTAEEYAEQMGYATDLTRAA